ncbi:Crp/Fnr family transcriptional regulator [Flavobacterium sp. FlaQc-47]|uniref:Crp/Fnr family transcriptional regulator n=1 Tax=Flavobacterium sp. FlaQc-47 TaxID=3374180 RepID=UPI00375798A3
MTDIFKDFITELAKVNKKDMDRIMSCINTYKVKRNTIILSQGEICSHYYFLEKGCMRTYYVTKEGLEKTRLISFDNTPVTALTSFITQKPSLEYIDALEDSELLSISQTDFFMLLDEIPSWALFYRKNLELAFAFQNSRIEDLVTLSAKERYEKLLKEQPHYIRRLSNRVVATYLGISQETLSRLKSK